LALLKSMPFPENIPIRNRRLLHFVILLQPIKELARGCYLLLHLLL